MIGGHSSFTVTRKPHFVYCSERWLLLLLPLFSLLTNNGGDDDLSGSDVCVGVEVGDSILFLSLRNNLHLSSKSSIKWVILKEFIKELRLPSAYPVEATLHTFLPPASLYQFALYKMMALSHIKCCLFHLTIWQPLSVVLGQI